MHTSPLVLDLRQNSYSGENPRSCTKANTYTCVCCMALVESVLCYLLCMFVPCTPYKARELALSEGLLKDPQQLKKKWKMSKVGIACTPVYAQGLLQTIMYM